LGNTEEANMDINELASSVAISAKTRRIKELLLSVDYKKTGAVSTTIHKIFKKN